MAWVVTGHLGDVVRARAARRNGGDHRVCTVGCLADCMRVATVVHGDGRECRRADQGCRPAGEGGELVVAAQSLGEDVTSGAAGGAEDRDPHRSFPLGADGSMEARARFRVRPSSAPMRPRMATPSGTWT